MAEIRGFFKLRFQNDSRGDFENDKIKNEKAIKILT